MSCSTALEDLTMMVAEMMKRKGIKDYDLDLQGNSNVGDGYMGNMVYFKVIVASGKTYNLVFKSASKSEKLRKAIPLEMTYDRELYMYTVVFPSIKSFFSKRCEISPLAEFIPRLYWYSGEYQKESFILENLREKGFTMWKRGEPLDFEHTKLVMRNLGKWHGTMMAYRDQNPESFKSWIPHLFEIRYKLLARTQQIEYSRKGFQKVLKLLEERGSHELVQKYKKFDSRIEEFVKPTSEKQDQLVIIHGDCWVNNIMFKGKKGETSQGIFLDFQFSYLNTPVEDLSFFLFTACDGAVLEKTDYLLEEYYSALSTTMKHLGSNPDDVFTFQQLQEHWKKYAFYGVVASIAVVQLQYFTDDEVPDLAEIFVSDGGRSIMDYLDLDMKNRSLYIERLLSVFSYYGNKHL